MAKNQLRHFFLPRIDQDSESRWQHFVELFGCLRFEQMSASELSDLKNYFHVAESDAANTIVDAELEKRSKNETEKSESPKTGGEVSESPKTEAGKSESPKSETLQHASSNAEMSNFRTKKRGPCFLPCVVGLVDERHWVLRYDYRFISYQKYITNIVSTFL
jgi:hypothetical protein